MVFNIRLRDQFDPENVYPKMCIRILQHFYVNIAFLESYAITVVYWWAKDIYKSLALEKIYNIKTL